MEYSKEQGESHERVLEQLEALAAMETERWAGEDQHVSGCVYWFVLFFVLFFFFFFEKNLC